VFGPHSRIFIERQLLQAGLKSIKEAPGTVDIHAAEGNDASGNAAEGIEQLGGLRARAEDKVDDGIEFFARELLTILGQAIAVADDLLNACWNTAIAAMENCYLMSGLLKVLDNKWTDKAGASDKKNFHVAAQSWLKVLHKIVEVAALDKGDAADFH
jgi:hypothetical protein